MKFLAEIRVRGDRRLVLAPFLAEEPNVGRSSLEFEEGVDGVVFKVRADDAVSFRAAVNGVTKMLAVIEKTGSL